MIQGNRFPLFTLHYITEKFTVRKNLGSPAEYINKKYLSVPQKVNVKIKKKTIDYTM
jgi:hypothetical protein